MQRVAGVGFSGAYAEYALAPAKTLVKVPDEVSSEQAAAVMLQGMTAHYLSHEAYPLQAGDTCLIHAAAGGTGLLLVQMAKEARGAGYWYGFHGGKRASSERSRCGRDHPLYGAGL